MSPCSVATCERPAFCKGMCTLHYQRMARHGSIDKPPGKQMASVVGQKFGRLTVTEMVRGAEMRLRCLCDCGRSIEALAYNVKDGNTSSCGCLARSARAATGRRLGPLQGKKNATHGKSGTPTYIAWLEARKRCFKPQNKRFVYYGGRGITMCKAWADSFEAFLADIGECPPGMTLERDDVDGNYEPGNCRWATKLEQARNKRSTIADWPMVCEIRRRSAGGESSASLAREFGMCWSNAKSIIAGDTWKTEA